MTEKITMDYILGQYGTAANHYKDYALDAGLWASEKYVFEKYVHLENNILDLGCGAGRTTFALYQLGFKNIQGIDITPEMINAAEDIKKKIDSPIHFQIGDAMDLPYVDRAFNVVFFSFNGMMSIPSISNRTKALTEIYRILVPG